jgi:DNA-binding MarR family transcriptional regulator
MESGESIGRTLGCLHRNAQKYFHREFSKLGLGSGTHLFLMLLHHHHDGVTQNEISNRLHFDKAHTARAIQRLIELGYITKEKDATDNRAYRIYLTDKARQIMPDIKRVLKSWSDILAAGLSETEQKQAMALLKKMSENAVEFMGEER